jgi:alanine racemase
MSHAYQTTWIEVNLAAIQRNIARMNELTGKPVMAVVKANAYGHGLVEVSRSAVEAGVIRLCVARFEEAMQLREKGIEIPILVMGYVTPVRVTEAIANNVALMVNSLDLAQQFNDTAATSSRSLDIHVKIDSGMHRLGLLADEIEPFCREVKKLRHLNIEGLFTHFPNADDLADDSTHGHIATFTKAVEYFQVARIYPSVIHAANSAASIYFPAARFDAIRTGIAIYGVNPDFGASLPTGFEPALTWTGRLTSIKKIPAGEGIGYNYRYRTLKTERIGVASVGYADGLRRRLGNLALIDGRRVNQVGGMCMDQSLWQLDDVPDAKVGDEIVFLGSQGNERLTAEDLGQLWGSNNYDVVCGLAARVHRYYFYR